MRGEKNLGPRRGGRLRAWASRLAAVAFWLVVWELAARAIDLKIILVGPSQVLVRLAELVATGEFWASVAPSAFWRRFSSAPRSPRSRAAGAPCESSLPP